MDIRWTPEASANLEDISLHIAKDNREAAIETVRTIFDRIERLAAFPQRGRLGLGNGTRELILAHLPYIVIYRIRGLDIEILHIWHGAQDRG